MKRVITIVLAMAMALSSAMTFIAHCMTISGMTGLTLPGMMELPC